MKTFVGFVNTKLCELKDDDCGCVSTYCSGENAQARTAQAGIWRCFDWTQVKAETVDAGKRISAPGVERIERALDDGWLQVARLSSKDKNTAHSIVSKGGLGAGEAESIALASSRKLMVIIDDRAARSFAEVMGVAFVGTAGMLFYGFVRKHLTLAELEDAVEELSKTIWLAPAVVAEVLKKAREAEQ